MYPEALERLLTSFYATGVADGSLYPETPMDFGAGMGFPAMMKIALAAIVVLVIALGFGAYAIVRHFRKRRYTRATSESN